MEISRRDFLALTIAALTAGCEAERTSYPEPVNFYEVKRERSEYVTGEIVRAGQSKLNRNLGEVWVDDGNIVYHIATEDGEIVMNGLLSDEGIVGRRATFPKNSVYWDSRSGKIIVRSYFNGSIGHMSADLLEIFDYSRDLRIVEK